MQNGSQLKHFGVKGMHWGVRRAENAARAAIPRSKEYSDESFAKDTKKYGKKGSARINERMSKGMNYADSKKMEQSRRRKKIALIVGGYYLARALTVYGPMLAQQGAESYVSKKTTSAGQKAASDLFSDSRGIGNYKIVDLGYDAKSKVWE